MTLPLAILAGYVAIALLATVAALRVPALRPAAATWWAMALLDAGALWGPWWAQAGVAVGWPGLLLAGAAWGLRAGPIGVYARRLPVARADDVSPTGRRSVSVTTVLLGGYLAAALLAVAWRPAYPALLVGGRVLAVGAVVALLARSRPRSWAQLAAVLPAIGLGVGVAAGAWPLAQAGLAAVAAGWHLARLETAATMLATAGAIAAAWRGARRAGARLSLNASGRALGLIGRPLRARRARRSR